MFAIYEVMTGMPLHKRADNAIKLTRRAPGYIRSSNPALFNTEEEAEAVKATLKRDRGFRLVVATFR